MGITKLHSWSNDVGPKDILQLQAANEGRIQLVSISECELDNWKSQYPEIIESDEIRYEYNFLSKGLLIKCTPLPTHDSLQIFFIRNVICSLDRRFGFLQAGEMVTVGSGTSFSGFTDDPSGASEKLPDAYVQLPDSDFPTVVCEAGWAEAYEQLVQDARLWLLHTSGQTRVVIVLSFTETMPKAQTVVIDNDATTQEISNEAVYDDATTQGTTNEALDDDATTQETPNEALDDDATTQEAPNEEELVLTSINEMTDLQDLAKQLLHLNQGGKLTQPLVGNLEANLYVYRPSEKGDDIVESFVARLLPPQPVEDLGPKEFGISLEELLGEFVPEGHSPKDEILFSLADLLKCIQKAIPRTEHLRATRRAKKLLKSIVGSGDEETFAQRKRRRLDPIGLWK